MIKANNTRLTVSEAAAIMGASPEWIRAAMREGILKIGWCMKSGRRWSYYISKDLLMRELGRGNKNGER